MAEKAQKMVYRSVSFKKLGSWSANNSKDQQHKSVESEAAGVALPPELTAAPQQHLATRNVSQSRKVSKIRATTAGLPTTDPKRGSSTPIASSISPSIRQLTEKFSSSSASSPGARITAPSDRAAVKRAEALFLGVETQGKSDLPLAILFTRIAQVDMYWIVVIQPGTPLLTIKCKKFSLEPILCLTTSVTPDPHHDLQPAAASESSSVSLDTSLCSTSFLQTKVREERGRQGVGLLRDSLHSSHSSSTEPAPTSFTPPPDKAASFSFSAAPNSGLRATERGGSLFISRWKFSSGEEEEQCSRRRGRSLSSSPVSSFCNTDERGTSDCGGSFLLLSKNGLWSGKGIGRSSGSEEDSPGCLSAPIRDAVRRRSLRKKKKVAHLPTGRADCDNDDDGESEDSDSDTDMTMEQTERQDTVGKQFVTSLTRSQSMREAGSYGHRFRVQQWERISSPSASTRPCVSRVSKVNIPPFLSSPGGSRSSSRYSSTETLKQDDQIGSHVGSNSRIINPSTSMLSKTYQGNFTMYRSPSFGHGDNISRTPVHVRSKFVPTVSATSSCVLARERGVYTGKGLNPNVRLRRAAFEERKNETTSMSNPDIESETLTLLNFLKSDLSELKMRKTSEMCSDGSSSYKMGLVNHSGTPFSSSRRPSLKDLTATLRRTKSFTYSEKPTVTVRGYMTSSSTKRSSSEQRLDLEGESSGGRGMVPDRGVESDSGDFRLGGHYSYDDEDDVMPTPLHDKYVQEARQVIQDICQMSTREDDADDSDVKKTEDVLNSKSFQMKQANEKEHNLSLSVNNQANTEEEHEYKNVKPKDKQEREQERNKESERGERDGPSMQLGKLNSQDTENRE
ncbi:hypothetical protein WMY93_029443 [Mugilogobius chulae]|uniref:Uncharacterized protein n=1 Tax=Mugilogobius chulae TaxID=88201 RepID=A0AAW0N259_9GOBI